MMRRYTNLIPRSHNRSELVGVVVTTPVATTVLSEHLWCAFDLVTIDDVRVETATGSTIEYSEHDRHRIVAWEDNARLCLEKVRGALWVRVTGWITNREWRDDRGRERKTCEVVAWQVEPLGKATPEEGQRVPVSPFDSLMAAPYTPPHELDPVTAWKLGLDDE